MFNDNRLIRMKVTVNEEFGSFVIKPHGMFGEQDCPLLQEALEKSTRSRSRLVLIDLKDLSNITIAGQRALLAYSGQLQTLRRPLVLYNVNQAVMAAFEDSGLIRVIHIASNLKEAQALATAGK
ncbi:MAG: hypothetical protein JWQ14_2137 [Adhaeribacter sp.]|jgi:anti-anti-sigma factor|nr:hypothetical protein [Adhaeribacter sp.]